MSRALANQFIKDPHEVVKPGQIVKVKVLGRRREASAYFPDHAPRRRTWYCSAFKRSGRRRRGERATESA